jgi:hypothetical protein
MKHHVSISTLRRRIKADDINFRFDDGKYFILDEAPQTQKVEAEAHRPSPKSEAFVSNGSEAFVSGRNDVSVTAHAAAGDTTARTASELAVLQMSTEKGESVLTAANKLLIDLKKAYTQVLHEKEEQIMNLKEEVIDLRTLIKVLESENSRLRETN